MHAAFILFIRRLSTKLNVKLSLDKNVEGCAIILIQRSAWVYFFSPYFIHFQLHSVEKCAHITQS